MSSTPQLQKVERVSQKYGLNNIGDELVDYWDDEGPDKSVRELATYFNFHVTDTALRNAGIILDREVVESIAKNSRQMTRSSQSLISAIVMSTSSGGVKLPVRPPLDQALILLWYALISVDVSKPGLLDAVADVMTQKALGEQLEEMLENTDPKMEQVMMKFVRGNHPKTDAIEKAYNNSWIPDRLHLDHTDVFTDLPDDTSPAPPAPASDT